MFSASLIKDENAAIAMMKIFVDMGVQASKPDALNQTPLYYAARDGKNQVIEYLVS
jgi:hypothetical protein